MTSKLPEEWRKVRLGEVIEIIGGGTPKRKEDTYWNGDIPWISVKDFMENEKYIKTTEEKITRKGLENSSTKILQEEDIIISARGTVGKLAIIKYPMAFNQSCYGLRTKKSILDSNYLYYFLKDNIEILKKQGHGSVFNTIIKSTLEKLYIQFPPLKEQEAIVSTLSSLDNKIEINNKINENLEKQSKAIFEHWFSDFEFPNENGAPYKSNEGEMIESELGMIPKGWKIIELNEVGDLTMGLSPKSDSYNFEEIGIPLLNGASDFKNGLLSAQKYTSTPTRVCKKNDLIFCIRATIGNLTFADKDYCIGRGVASITPKKEDYRGLIYYNLLMSMARLVANASGSVILGLSKPDINDMKIILPEEKILKSFSNISNSIFKKKNINELEIKTLSQLRDNLLSNLMSGEIRIPLD